MGSKHRGYEIRGERVTVPATPGFARVVDDDVFTRLARKDRDVFE